MAITIPLKCKSITNNLSCPKKSILIHTYRLVFHQLAVSALLDFGIGTKAMSFVDFVF